MSNSPISRSPEASVGIGENGAQRASSLSIIGVDSSQPYQSTPRGIGFAHTDVVNAEEELHVTLAAPVQRSFPANSRLVLALANLTTRGSELDMSFGKVEVVAGAEVILTLEKAAPQQVATLSGTHTFRLAPWSGGGDAPVACVAVALAE